MPPSKTLNGKYPKNPPKTQLNNSGISATVNGVRRNVEDGHCSTSPAFVYPVRGACLMVKSGLGGPPARRGHR